MSEPVKEVDLKKSGAGSVDLERNLFEGLGGELRDEPAEKPEEHPEAIWIGNRWWIPNDEWRKLEGMLKDSRLDTSEQRARERALELEHDAGKFGNVS